MMAGTNEEFRRECATLPIGKWSDELTAQIEHMHWKYHIAPYLCVSLGLSYVLYLAAGLIASRTAPLFHQTPEQSRIVWVMIWGSLLTAWVAYPIGVVLYRWVGREA